MSFQTMDQSKICSPRVATRNKSSYLRPNERRFLESIYRTLATFFSPFSGMMGGASCKRTSAKALDAPHLSANRLHKVVRLFSLLIKNLSPKDNVRLTRNISELKSRYLLIIRKVKDYNKIS